MNRNLDNISRYVGYGVIAIVLMVLFRLIMPTTNGTIGVWIAGFVFAAIVVYFFESDYRAKNK